jgi:hypothetical protein
LLSITLTVPSLAMLTLVSGGMAIGPPSPSTVWPLLVCRMPFSLTFRLPLRV